ncbi:MAG: flavodoxin family protein [Clostridia bacterium]|nr:flavodoxin family protein [Clostridia bacterium]
MKTVLINGSPKKKWSVSSYLSAVLRLAIGGTTVREQVRSKADHARVLEELRDADAVVFVTPLYVDAVPSHLLVFMQEMEQFCRENGIVLRVYALANNGFIEGRQNMVLMQVLECFCQRCGHIWGGGLGIGGGIFLNALRFVVPSYFLLFALNLISSSLGEALPLLLWQLAIALVLHSGVLVCGIPLVQAIRRGSKCKTRYTRVMVPAVLFIVIANMFFSISALLRGGMFRGWLAKK